MATSRWICFLAISGPQKSHIVKYFELNNYENETKKEICITVENVVRRKLIASNACATGEN